MLRTMTRRWFILTNYYAVITGENTGFLSEARNSNSKELSL